MLTLVLLYTFVNNWSMYYPLSKGAIKNLLELSWNNTYIKSNIKPFFVHEWVDKGIVFIEHIYDYRNKQFFNFNKIYNLYNVPQTDFFIYYQLTTCIPYQWKGKL